ncbi:MAG: putative toxin-antitoxin system toxin component, PIN family [Arcicella sp.]|nr:putative toxin-antitoxin system toxin component, PIN family [Arcicella sp.]
MFEYVLENKFIVCVSEVILDDYRDVLNRPKFKRFPNFVEKTTDLLDSIEKISEYYQPTTTIERTFDHADNRFLELAITANAHYIVTGNFTDFDFAEYEKIKILSPKYFYEEVCVK